MQGDPGAANTKTDDDEVLPTELSWSAVTDVGRFRRSNEDAFLALRMDSLEVRRLGKLGSASLCDGDYIFAVSDGMGGHNAGEFASQIAVEKITELLPAAFRLDIQGIGRGAPDLLEQVFEEIHAEIRRLGQAYAEVEGMGATLSLCWFSKNWMNFCHIGDSRIYFLPARGDIRQITEDHTHVGWLQRTGQITAMQARYHPARNQLNQALTAGSRTITPHLGSVGYGPGDRFVICSDGLNEGLSDKGIDHIIRDQPERIAHLPAADAIVKESVQASGKDNTTAVVIEVM